MVLFLCSHADGQDQKETPPGNIDLLREVAHTMGTELASEITGGTVFLAILPPESAWYIETGLRRGLLDGGLALMSRDSADIALEIGFRNSRITYGNNRRKSVFGERIADRRVDLTLTAKAIHQRTGTVILSRDLSSSFADIIAVADIERVENPILPITKGSMESEGFFGNVIEPAVVLGALGIAIYLLFNVRS